MVSSLYNSCKEGVTQAAQWVTKNPVKATAGAACLLTAINCRRHIWTGTRMYVGLATFVAAPLNCMIGSFVFLPAAVCEQIAFNVLKKNPPTEEVKIPFVVPVRKELVDSLSPTGRAILYPVMLILSPLHAFTPSLRHYLTGAMHWTILADRIASLPILKYTLFTPYHLSAKGLEAVLSLIVSSRSINTFAHGPWLQFVDKILVTWSAIFSDCLFSL